MNKRFYSKVYLFTAALTASFSAHAALDDVTTQYISNPGFEECPTATIVDGAVQLIANDKTPVDYEEYGWKCIGGFNGSSSYNAGVATYPIKIKYSKWLNGLDGPATSPYDGENTKALCFTGNKSAVYQSPAIELPAGTYLFTVNVWAYNGGTSNPSPTIDVQVATGFIADNGTEYLSEKDRFLSSAWDTDVIKIELTEATKGHFQLCYGASYFVVIDDVKLEYEGGVITTSLETVVDKADALNDILNSEPLGDAIKNALQFIANPTSQTDVAAQIETLYAAMGAALTASPSDEAINITAAYLENASFENGIAPWEGTARATEPSASLSITPNIHGSHIASFDYDESSCKLWQETEYLPAGFYMVETLLSDQAKIQLGTVTKTWTGGTNGLYLRVYSPIVELTEAGSLLVGAVGISKTSFDNFRLYYAKDRATLEQTALAAVSADAQLWLDKAEYSNVTGSERLAINVAIEDDYADVMSQIAEINTDIAQFIEAKENYNKWVAAKENAAIYTEEAYPYAKQDLHQQIQGLVNTTVHSGQHAADLKELLADACRELIISNAYCEGIVDAVDYTDKIVGANATAGDVPSAWQASNMTIRTDNNIAWVNPKTQESDQAVYGVTTDYYRNSNETKSSMRQIISGLPKGQYVLSIAYMSPEAVRPVVNIDGMNVGELKGVGKYSGGIYGTGWVENVIPFEKKDDTNMILRIEYTGTANYQEWYFDNLRIYRIDKDEEDIEVGISHVASAADEIVFDLQGRRVAQPVKGIYIVRGKKVIR